MFLKAGYRIIEWYFTLDIWDIIAMDDGGVSDSATATHPWLGRPQGREVAGLSDSIHHRSCGHQQVVVVYQQRSNRSSEDLGKERDYPNGPQAGREAGLGSEFVPLKKRKVGNFILLHQIFHEPHVVLEYERFWNNIIAMKTLPSDTPIINI